MGWWSGEAPSTSLSGYTPWIKSPGYDFSSTLYSYLTSMIGQPSPRFNARANGGVRAGPAIAPQMQALMGLGKRYMNTGMPTTFGTGISSLGRFLAPSFANPFARMQQGYPDYFGAAQMGGGGFNPMAQQGAPPPGPMQQAPPGPQGFRYDPNNQPGLFY